MGMQNRLQLNILHLDMLPEDLANDSVRSPKLWTWQTSRKGDRNDVLLTQEIPAGSVKRTGLSEELEEVSAHGDNASAAVP
ncbi:hypothetical protein LEMLEM_LOCUS4195 [Lemmus lemmus]